MEEGETECFLKRRQKITIILKALNSETLRAVPFALMQESDLVCGYCNLGIIVLPDTGTQGCSLTQSVLLCA